MSNDNKHTANFLVSLFLSSKRSLKKIYGLRNSHITILRYICDSIDLNYKKRKKFETKLYQSQIGTFSRNSLRTVNSHIGYLIRKKFIICIDEKKRLYTIGKVLTTYATIAYTLEVRKNRHEERSTQPLRISNSSNFTNKQKPLIESKKENKELHSTVPVYEQKEATQNTMSQQSKNEFHEMTQALIEGRRWPPQNN